jgi:hypothetical protein
LLALIRAAVGIALTFAAGIVCADGVSESFCGRNFLVWNLSSGAAFAWVGMFGAVVGALLGWSAALLLTRRSVG